MRTTAAPLCGGMLLALAAAGKKPRLLGEPGGLFKERRDQCKIRKLKEIMVHIYRSIEASVF